MSAAFTTVLPASTHISYTLGDRGPVSLRVFDVSGRLVRTLVDGPVEAGQHTIVFDGRSATGRSLASGIYFLRMDTPDVTQVRQVTLLK